MTIAVYPGSFNPWHDGHEDVLMKALNVFDKVIVATGYNPEKKNTLKEIPENTQKFLKFAGAGRVSFISFPGLLVDLISKLEVDAVVKGLRNIQDFEDEKVQQYWNEDLGLKIPVIYFICNREFTHISSSAIKAINKVRERK